LPAREYHDETIICFLIFIFNLNLYRFRVQINKLYKISVSINNCRLNTRANR